MLREKAPMNHRHFIISVACATVSLFLASCRPAFGPGPADFSAKLTGDYFVHRTSAHQIIISPQNYSDETPIIPTKVVECALYRDLIMAKRQGLKRRSPNNPNDTYEEPDETAFDYWILDTAAPKVFGPMSLAEFNAKRHELLVPESIALKDIYTFRAGWPIIVLVMLAVFGVGLVVFLLRRRSNTTMNRSFSDHKPL